MNGTLKCVRSNVCITLGENLGCVKSSNCNLRWNSLSGNRSLIKLSLEGRKWEISVRRNTTVSPKGWDAASVRMLGIDSYSERCERRSCKDSDRREWDSHGSTSYSLYPLATLEGAMIIAKDSSIWKYCCPSSYHIFVIYRKIVCRGTQNFYRLDRVIGAWIQILEGRS